MKIIGLLFCLVFININTFSQEVVINEKLSILIDNSQNIEIGKNIDFYSSYYGEPNFIEPNPGGYGYSYFDWWLWFFTDPDKNIDVISMAFYSATEDDRDKINRTSLKSISILDLKITDKTSYVELKQWLKTNSYDFEVKERSNHFKVKFIYANKTKVILIVDKESSYIKKVQLYKP